MKECGYHLVILRVPYIVDIAPGLVSKVLSNQQSEWFL